VELALKLEPLLRKKAKENEAASGGDRKSQKARSGSQISANPIKPMDTREELARVAGVSHDTVTKAKRIIEEATESEKAMLRNSETTINRVASVLRHRASLGVRVTEKETKTALAGRARMDLEKVCTMTLCSMEKLLKEVEGVDAIITDPPYAKECISSYDNLARLAAEKDVPVVAVMCGQTYLPQVMEVMVKHLAYRWTLAYLTPGGQSVQQWVAKVNTFWKPILLFGKASEWLGDVVKSDPNDNDKAHHEWGQSESGMSDLVSRLTKPGQLVCDPFLGGGTTALVSIALGRRFVGCDVAMRCITTAWERLEKWRRSDG